MTIGAHQPPSKLHEMCLIKMTNIESAIGRKKAGFHPT